MALKRPTAPPEAWDGHSTPGSPPVAFQPIAEPVPAAAPVADVDQLAAALAAPEPAERRRAARELGAFPEAVPLLCARLGTETAPSVRMVILSALIRLKSEAVVAGLLPFLSSEDVGLRNAVIEALQDMPSELEPHVARILADPDSDVRIFAVNVLSLLPHPEAPRWLTEVILRDSHVNVCAAALDGLAEAGDERAIAPLEALPARFPDVPFMGFAVAAAIRRIRGQ